MPIVNSDVYDYVPVYSNTVLSLMRFVNDMMTTNLSLVCCLFFLYEIYEADYILFSLYQAAVIELFNLINA